MQAFEYSAVDQQGKPTKGTISADGPAEAKRSLLARQLYVTDIKPAGGRTSSSMHSFLLVCAPGKKSAPKN